MTWIKMFLCWHRWNFEYRYFCGTAIKYNICTKCGKATSKRVWKGC